MSSIIDFFAQESAGGNILGFFYGYFIINFSRRSLWDQIFRDQMFQVLLMHFFINFVSKRLREQMFENFSATYH